MDRMYAIVNAADFQREVAVGHIDIGLMFSKILESSPSTLRYCNDKSLFTIKSDDLADIDYLRSRALELNIGYTEYTLEELYTVIDTPEWVLIVPFPS